MLRLREIGVVRSNADLALWELAAPRAVLDWDAPVDGRGNGNGNGNDGLGDGGAGSPGDQGGGGAGLSEVLAHPILFCMTEADQDGLLKVALGLPPDLGNNEMGNNRGRA